MKHTYSVTGMTCNNCKASVEKKLEAVEGVTQVFANVEKGETVVTMDFHIDTQKLQNALPEKYTLTDKNIFNTEGASSEKGIEKSKFQQLKPLFLIFGYISMAAVLMNVRLWDTRNFMLDFMGIFFFVFSFFKFLDLKGFASSFSMYDPLAREFPFYGKIYPFLELALGIMFFIRFEVEVALAATICILLITTIGVINVLANKKNVQCACLGSVLQLPMTLATFIENAIMIAMAMLMITSWV